VRVDLNADLGESHGSWRKGDDDALLDVVTSANVACGFHAGDPVTMRRTCISAAARGVVVGAHPSCPDLVGFGRRRMELSGEELTASVVYQLGALDACCRAAGTRLAYVKPHGALYHEVSRNTAAARAFVLGVVGVGALAVLGPAGSELLTAAAELGLPTDAVLFDVENDRLRCSSRAWPYGSCPSPDRLSLIAAPSLVPGSSC
jgi:UPF0271 protein